MLKSKVFLFLFFSPLILFSQDSLRVLNVEQLIQIVKTYHPVVKQASIEVQMASANILNARSAFDPVLRHYEAKKTFDNVNYYQYSGTELSIPTWYGIEVKAGLENLSGNKTDASQYLGQSNYVGISIPLLKNLVLDKRRAHLQQAKIMKNQVQMEQRLVINDIIMEAIEHYWNWVKAYQTYQIYKQVEQVNKERFQLVKKSYLNGERPAIDTIEAMAQWQSITIKKESEKLKFINAGVQLSAYLWTANENPYEISQNLIPNEAWLNEVNLKNFNLNLTDLCQTANKNHPYLLAYQYKIESLEVNQRLKFQELLPKVDYQYNQLGKKDHIFNTATQFPLYQNNFQYGLKVEIPLRFSQGRSEYKLAKFKIKEVQYDIDMKQLEIQNKIEMYYNQYQTLKSQVDMQLSNLTMYNTLVSAEMTRYQNGESTLFLINSRENKALESQEKWIEYQTQYFKTLYSVQWSAGLLY